MYIRFLWASLLTIFCFSSPLFSQALPPDEVAEEIDEEEDLVDEIEFQEVNDDFDDLEEEDGVFVEEYGPIEQNMYVDITDGSLEDYHERQDRMDSYFSAPETAMATEEVHLTEGSEEHVHPE